MSGRWVPLRRVAVFLALVLPLFLVSNVHAQSDRWMDELVVQYGANPSPMDQSLATFIFPGSHNSATYGIPDFLCKFGTDCEGLSGHVDPLDAPPLACDDCIDPETRDILETPGLDILMGYFMTPRIASTDSG